MPNIHYIDWGVIPYDCAWQKQKELFLRVVTAKQKKEDLNYLLFCEHPHVYTLGKSGEMSNMLLTSSLLKNKGIVLHRVDRGGDITYHGYGQIVVYPILNLSIWKFGIKEYIYRLEKSIIETIEEYDIKGERLDDAPGVWLGIGGKNIRKICAIGVKASRHITMHGLALNVNTDLNYFDYINPCGFKDKGVTSIAKELNRIIDCKAVKNKLKYYITKNFEMEISNG